MATNFPVTPVRRLPIFAEEACNAAVLMNMIGAGGTAREELGDGSRWGTAAGDDSHRKKR